MKTKVVNYGHLKEEEITNRTIRVKGIILNSKEELLLAEAFTTIQFPGGHLEEGETLNEALKREILEETGIILNQEYEPFFNLKYYLKDYPKTGENGSIEIYYFYIKTEEPYNLKNTHLDDQEQNGGFHLTYIKKKDLKKYLKSHPGNLKINKIVANEMLLAMKVLKKSGDEK